MPNTPSSSLNRQNVKKYILLALQIIGKFIGGVGAIVILFFVFILAFARGFLELNPDQYQMLKVGLLFLLFFLIAIPMRFKVQPLQETFRRIFRRVPRFTQAQLLQFAWLVAKIVLWTIALLIITLWVSDVLYPQLDDPDGYVDLGSDLELLLYLSAAFVSIRLIILHFYPKFSYGTLIENVKKFIIKRNISTFFAITSFILLIFSMFIFGNFFVGNQKSTLRWAPEEYSQDTSEAKISINTFSPQQGKISGVLLLNTGSQENNEILRNNQYLVFNFSKLPITHGDSYSYVYSAVDIEISGSDYYFPFNQYEVKYLIFSPEYGRLQGGYNLEVESKLSSIVFQENYEPTLSSGPYSFYIRYSLYFKLLVITIGIAFAGFFVSVLMAKTRNQIIELGIGIFAALIAIRGFLIPENISSPIFIDQLFLLYIISLLILLFIRINQVNWEK